MAGAADRCVIPEHPFDVEHLAGLLVKDRNQDPSKYDILLNGMDIWKLLRKWVVWFWRMPAVLVLVNGPGMVQIKKKKIR